jgi:hypothetical protein
MDINTAVVIGLGFAMMCAVALAALFRSAGSTHITTGDNAQTNVNGERQTTAGAITTIQVYEDALAELNEVADILNALGECSLALREGRYNGDFLGQVEDLAGDGKKHTQFLNFMLVQARANAYPHRWTVRERDARFSEQANGKHVP